MQTCVDLLLYIVISIFTLLFFWLFHKWFSERKLPPGPIGLPIVGYLPFLNDESYKTFSELNRKYGNIFSLKLGTKTVVVLGDEKALKECFIRQSDIFSGRSQEFSISRYFFDNKTLVVVDGDENKIHRRLILNQFKEFGIGTSSFETKLHDEIENFITVVKAKNGLDFEAHQLIFSLIANVICDFIIGKRFEYSDPNLKDLANIIHEFTNKSNQIGLLEFLPFLRHIPLKWTSLKPLSQCKRVLNQYFGRIIDEHEKTLDEKNIRDLTDAYLIYIKENPNDKYITRDHILENVKTMFIAGVETLHSFLQWGFNLMAKYPDVQNKVREEIKQVTGLNRFVYFSDRKNMPYTEATINEIHRFSTFAPVSFIHCNIVDTTVFGYEIPRRTRFLVNMWHLNNDPKVWKEPEKFDPSRFLTEDGKLNDMKMHIFPFLAGKRSCLGEGIGMTLSFLFFSYILQHFDLQPPSNTPHVIDIKNGLTRNLNSCCIRFIPLH